MLSGEDVWFVTTNVDKFREARWILALHGIEIRQLNRRKLEIQDPRPENIARFALETVLESQRGLVVVEDSGLFVEALAGFPGPFSSYILETIGLNGILELMRNVRHRRAYFQSSIAVGSASFSPRVFTGRVDGRISRGIRGRGGFGYDPIFIPDSYRKTFGEVSEEFKNQTSHRARAFLKFARWYLTTSAGRKIRTSKRALK